MVGKNHRAAISNVRSEFGSFYTEAGRGAFFCSIVNVWYNGCENVCVNVKQFMSDRSINVVCFLSKIPLSSTVGTRNIDDAADAMLLFSVNP